MRCTQQWLSQIHFQQYSPTAHVLNIIQVKRFRKIIQKRLQKKGFTFQKWNIELRQTITLPSCAIANKINGTSIEMNKIIQLNGVKCLNFNNLYVIFIESMECQEVFIIGVVEVYRNVIEERINCKHPSTNETTNIFRIILLYEVSIEYNEIY